MFKWVYSLEFLAAFIIPVCLWLISVILLPGLFIGIYSAPNVIFFVMSLVAVLMGAFGLYGALGLLMLTLFRDKENTPATRLKVYLVLGVLDCIFLTGLFLWQSSLIFMFIFLPAVLVTGHFYWLNKAYFK